MAYEAAIGHCLSHADGRRYALQLLALAVPLGWPGDATAVPPKA
jgi:hypothetical protein